MRRTGIDFEAYTRMAQNVENLAQAPSVTEITKPAQHAPALHDLYEHGYRKGLRTGWPSLDEYFTIRTGEVTIVTGIPGHGKSSWLDNLMVNASKLHDWKWAVFSAENFPVSRHIAGLCEIYTNRPFLRGVHERMSSTDLRIAIEFLDAHFVFIQPSEDSYSLNRIVQLAAGVEGLNALVIDPWNELDHTRPSDMREDQYISVALSKIRWLARSADIAIFVVAHPAKYIRQHGQPKPVITLNEIKGASEWYAKADNGISVWRDEGDRDKPTEVHVQKIRFREVGRVGMANLFYDRVTGRFNDPNYRPTFADYIREPGEEG